MNPLDILAGAAPSIYKIKEFKYKEFLASKYSVIVLDEKVRNFLATNPISGIDDSNDPWTKQEKSQFYTTYHNLNPSILTHIQGAFHKVYKERLDNLKSYTKPEKLLENLKQINQVNNFLKAYPYSENSFVKSLNVKMIELVISGENENAINNIKNALSLGLSKETILNFANVINPQDNYVSYMKQSRDIEINNSTIGTYFAGVTTLTSTVVFSSYIDKAYTSLKDEIGDLIPYVPQIAEKVVTTIQENQGLAYVAAFTALIGIWKVTEKSYNSIDSLATEKKTWGKEAKDITKEVFIDKISHNLMYPLARRREFDVNNSENKSSLILNSFAVEKLRKPGLKISDLETSLGASLGLSTTQIKNINDLTEDKIHEISVIKNPQIRDLFFKHDMNFEQKKILKNIDSVEQVIGFKSQDKGLPFNSLDGGFKAGLISKINHKLANPINKGILQAYFAMCIDDEGKLDNRAVQVIIDAEKGNYLNSTKFLDELSKHIEEKFKQLQKDAPTGGMWGSIKKNMLGTISVDTNNDVKLILDDIALKSGFNNLKNTIESYKYFKLNEKASFTTGVVGKIADGTADFVKNNIEKLRKKIFYSSTPPSGPGGPP